MSEDAARIAYLESQLAERNQEVFGLKKIVAKQKDVLDRQNERVRYYIETTTALQQELQEYRDKEE